MKLKENFVLRNIADTWVVLALGSATINFNGMLTLNESGAMLWKVLEQGGNRDSMAEALTAEYRITKEQALTDVDAFYKKLVSAGCAEEL